MTAAIPQGADGRIRGRACDRNLVVAGTVAVDRGHGDQSLLAQFGLSPAKASAPHPKVAGYNGIFSPGIHAIKNDE